VRNIVDFEHLESEVDPLGHVRDGAVVEALDGLGGERLLSRG
jgi:hypothetical protein